ncbi:MAG: helix-turn-helix domain-containing protein [bacterium]
MSPATPAIGNYFAYLPETGTAEVWSAEVTAAGRTQVRPGEPYPPAQHPTDHHFTWERGRVLDAHQLIHISAGTGTFESDATGSVPIRAGDTFLLLPHVWHRYRPDRRSGWTEHWVECKGPTVDRLVQRGLIRADRPVVRTTNRQYVLQCFELLHQWIKPGDVQTRAHLATMAMHLYALVQRYDEVQRGPQRRIDRLVQQAQMKIAARVHQPLQAEALADELGVAYSYFRRAFRARVGASPKHYHVQLRLRKARELLANTSMTIKQVADALGFDSPYHFSQQFKQHVGAAPTHWRRGLFR